MRNDPRRQNSEPMPGLSRSLGNLLIATAQLRYVHDQIVVQAESGTVNQAAEWLQLSHHMIDLHDKIVESIAQMRFTGPASEHPMIRSADGIVIPVDSGYVTVLTRRMDRHTRIGRVLALGSVGAQQEQVSA